MINISNKRYAVVQGNSVKNKDILITENGNYYPEDGYLYNLVRVKLPDPVYEEITVNPKIITQEFTSSVDGFSKVTVTPVTYSIDENIKPENIKKDITILGITGTVEFLTEDIEITPNKNVQNFIPTKDGFYNIKVNAVTSDIDSNIKEENILSGVNILGVTGNVIRSNETTRNITDNGTYIPENPYTGFSEVVVNIPIVIEELNVTPSKSQQTFTGTQQYHGFSPVIVAPVTADIDNNIIASNIRKDVTILGVTGNIEELNSTELTITDNGEYLPQNPYNAFSKVTVDINTVNNTDITITDEGEYTPEEPYTGFGKVIVDLTWIRQALQNLNAGDADTSINLQNKTITNAGNYTADAGYDGLGIVTVDLSWVDEAIEQAKQGTPDGTADQLVDNSAVSILIDADRVRQYAFYQNTNLRKVILNNAQSIGSYAFSGTNLQTLIINTSTLCTLDSNVFTTSPDIYVPDNLVNTYKTASNWSTYSSKIKSINEL